MVCIQIIRLISTLLLFAPVERDERASALLEHVYLHRSISDDGLHISFEFQQDETGPLQCSLYQLGAKLRVDINGENIHEAIWHDGEYVWIWGEGNDLERTNLKYLQKQGRFFFKAECIGLLMSLTSAIDLEKVISRDRDIAVLAPPRTCNSTKCQVIEISNQESVLEYVIDVPNLRVYEVIARSSSQDSKLSCRYIDRSEFPWLPASVSFQSNVRPSYNLESITVTGGASNHDFTIAGAKIPIGTAVVDRDQQFRLGYWTGTQIDEEFSHATSTPQRRSSIWMYVAGSCLTAGLVFVAFRLYRK